MSIFAAVSREHAEHQKRKKRGFAKKGAMGLPKGRRGGGGGGLQKNCHVSQIDFSAELGPVFHGGQLHTVNIFMHSMQNNFSSNICTVLVLYTAKKFIYLYWPRVTLFNGNS